MHVLHLRRDDNDGQRARAVTRGLNRPRARDVDALQEASTQDGKEGGGGCCKPLLRTPVTAHALPLHHVAPHVAVTAHTTQPACPHHTPHSPAPHLNVQDVSRKLQALESSRSSDGADLREAAAGGRRGLGALRCCEAAREGGPLLACESAESLHMARSVVISSLKNASQRRRK